MESEQAIWIVLGAFAILCGVGLAVAKLDKRELEESVHSNPGLALYRFSWYRWGAVLVCIGGGIIVLVEGLGWVDWF